MGIYGAFMNGWKEGRIEWICRESVGGHALRLWTLQQEERDRVSKTLAEKISYEVGRFLNLY